MFTDGALLMLNNPKEAFPEIQGTLLIFMEAAGLEVDYSESSVPCGETPLEEQLLLQMQFGLRLQPHSTTHLGITIPKGLRRLKKQNVEMLLEDCRKDMDCWRKLNLAQLGRTATIIITLLFLFA